MWSVAGYAMLCVVPMASLDGLCARVCACACTLQCVCIAWYGSVHKLMCYLPFHLAEK